MRFRRKREPQDARDLQPYFVSGPKSLAGSIQPVWRRQQDLDEAHAIIVGLLADPDSDAFQRRARTFLANYETRRQS